MFVVLKGTVAISQRDGLGHVVPIVAPGPRPVPGRGRAALRPPRAGRRRSPTTTSRRCWSRPSQLRALIIAEADLGERIVRALILRRVGADRVRRERAGADRRSRSRPSCCGCRTSCAATASRITWSTRRRTPTPPRCSSSTARAPSDVLVVCPDGIGAGQSRPRRARALPRHARHRRARRALRRRRRRRRARRASRRRSTRPPKGLHVVVLDCRSYGGQAGASARIENYLGFPDRHLRRRRSPAARSCRRRSSAPRC